MGKDKDREYVIISDSDLSILFFRETHYQQINALYQLLSHHPTSGPVSSSLKNGLTVPNFLQSRGYNIDL